MQYLAHQMAHAQLQLGAQGLQIEERPFALTANGRIGRVSRWTYAWTTRACICQNNLGAARTGGGVTLACA